MVIKLSVFPADSFVHVKPKENSYSIVSKCNQKDFTSKHEGSLQSKNYDFRKEINKIDIFQKENALL